MRNRKHIPNNIHNRFWNSYGIDCKITEEIDRYNYIQKKYSIFTDEKSRHTALKINSA